jgi:putative intracellular protease/amidase
MTMSRFAVVLVLAAVLWVAAVPAAAQTVIYVPFDNRPVSLDYVAETAKAAGLELVTPPACLLGSRTGPGNPDGLWRWLLANCHTADAVVASSDALLYGSLVASRTHDFPEQVIEERLARLAALKALRPGLRVYVFGTIMRTPRASAGGTEPGYYEVHGPSIFRITALKDKGETDGLTRAEEAELSRLLAAVPEAALADWFARRDKNYAANVRLLSFARDGTLAYFLLGRDDCAPFSQSHREWRYIAREAEGLPASRFVSFPGADQLGMLLVVRAANDAAVRMPLVQAFYAPGAGPETVASYEDTAVGRNVADHVVAAGGLLMACRRPDLVLAVNTPEDGVTHEAGSLLNGRRMTAARFVFAGRVAGAVDAGQQVAVGDVAFANGADNALMAELARRGVLFRLAAYSGWNTASNTLGYAIGQGMLAPRMPAEAKDRLIATRLLDDWGYQANVRWAVGREVLYPAGGSWFYLNELGPRVAAETERRLRAFAAASFPDYRLGRMQATMPWNRMFEVQVRLQ